MAGDWIPRDKRLTHKQEVVRVASMTGLSQREVAATLEDFWSWADDQTEDGFLPGISVTLLSHIIRDTDETFWRAVVSVGWLEEFTTGVRIPNFDNWMGKSAKKRLRAAQRQRRSRHNRTPENPPVTDSSRDECDKSVTTGEDRTVLEEELPNGSSSSAAKPRERDGVWDALCEAFGLKPQTKTECSRVGKHVRDLKLKGATPDEVRVRLERYRRIWPNVAATPEALLKHWDTLAVEPRAGESTADKIARAMNEKGRQG